MKQFFLILTFYLFIFSAHSHSQWIEQLLPGDIEVCFGIDFVNQNHGVIGGEHINLAGQFLANAFYTFDAGTNWIEATIPGSMRVMLDIKLFDDNIGYGVGAYNLSIISYKQNNIQQDISLHPLVKKYFEKIGMAFNRQEDYRGYFVETTDGGISWHSKGAFEDSVYYVLGIHFFDQQNGLVLASGPEGLSFAILKTSDGGISWNDVYPFEHYLRLNEIEFFDQLNGIAVGSFGQMGYSGVILKTVDGGNSWTKLELPFVVELNKVIYLDVNTILISGTNQVFQGVIFKSEDGGVNWQEFRNYGDMAGVSEMNSLQALGVILICGISQQSGLSMPFTEITIDNGLTWHYSQLSGFENYFLFSSELVDESRWYMTGTRSISQGFVLFTENSGGVPVELISFTSNIVDGKVILNWSTASEINNHGFEVERRSGDEDWRIIGFVEGKGTSTEIQNYSFIDDLFSVNNPKLYYRLKQIDLNGSFEYSDIIEVELNILKDLKLEQNYPNPFNPTTKIKFTIPLSPLLGGDGRGGLVTLKVYDVLGNEIATLVNEELPAGEYEVEFSAKGGSASGGDAYNLPSGIYFYQLIAGGPETSSPQGQAGQRIIQTKKMVLLK